MEEYRDKDLAVLNTFEKNDARDALELLVKYSIERKL